MNLVSIILPTYNRQSFLPDAFRSIRQQKHTNWELIIVDDGSTDDSLLLLEELKTTVVNVVKIISQENSGPAAARNRGIQEAKGDFIAFFDSDDYWHSEHLSLALQNFSEFPQLEWIYFACKRVNKFTGKTLLESTFYDYGRPNKLFDVSALLKDKVYILDNNDAVLAQITSGVDSGFQNSVFKRHVFEQLSIPDFRIGEDRLFILQALKHGIKTAFCDQVTVIYYVHDDNSSDTDANSTNYEKRIDSMVRLISSYQATFSEVKLTDRERYELKKRLSEDYFWKLGYSLQLASYQYLPSLSNMWKGIKFFPWKLKYWKTFFITALRALNNKLIRRLIFTRMLRRLVNKPSVLILGDSHAEVFNRDEFRAAFKNYLFTVASVGGATISGLTNPNSKTQAMPIFRRYFYNLKPDIIITLIGEVDTGFVIWHKAARKDLSIENVLDVSIKNYGSLLEEFSTCQSIVVSAPLPTIKDGQDWGEIANARKGITATQKERTDLTIKFNELMTDYCQKNQMISINMDEQSLGEDGLAKSFLLNNDVNDHHYNQQAYVKMLIDALKEKI